MKKLLLLLLLTTPFFFASCSDDDDSSDNSIKVSVVPPTSKVVAFQLKGNGIKINWGDGKTETTQK